MNLQQSPPREAQALIPDPLPELVPVAKIAERFRGVIIENLRRMTAARWGTPTENTMALPLEHHREDPKITDQETELPLVIGGGLLRGLGTIMIQDQGIMTPGSTPAARRAKWSIPGEDTPSTGLMTTTGKAAPTPGKDHHPEGDRRPEGGHRQEEGRQPGPRPEDRHQDRGKQGHIADMEDRHQEMMTGQVRTGLDH